MTFFPFQVQRLAPGVSFVPPVRVATQVFEVAAGRLQRGRIFMTWEEALEAAGLSE